jgi:hypothetical protein
MVRFIRIRGKIVPIIQKAVAKGSGYFGRASKMKSHEESIKALSNIRKGLSNKKEIGRGVEAVVYGYKGKAIKRLNHNIPDFKIERRFSVENALNRVGNSPKGILVKTNSRTYIVQDKIKKTALESYESMVDNYPSLRGGNAGKPIGDAIEKANEIGQKRFKIEGIDDHWDNWGFTGKSNKAKLLDGGHAGFDQWKGDKGFGGSSRHIRYWPERMAKLLSRSKTIKQPPVTQRTKLTDEEYKALKAIDRFNLLGKK